MNWQKQRQNVLERVAFIPGGVDREGNALLVVSTSTVQECSYEQLVSLLALLSDTLPSSTVFTVLIDTRHIQLKQLKFYLRATQQALYKKVRQVLIIQPDKFIEQQKINFDLIVSGYTLKTILISMHKLSKFVDVNQLPEQFGGTFDYSPEKWLENRLEITKWQDYVVEAGSDRSKHDLEKDQKLDEFVAKLLVTKRVDDEFAANLLKKSIEGVKNREDRDNKEELIEEHAAGVNRHLDWLEGSGEKWLNSLCQIADNVDEADSLMKQHEELTSKSKEVEEQTQQLAEMATRLMAVCPQYSISLHKMREQVGHVGEHFSRRVDAQTQFAQSNRAFQGKLADFTKHTDAILEKLCADDDNSFNDLNELEKKKKELDDQLTSLNSSYERAMEAGRETIRKTNQFADVLPAEHFANHISSNLTYISQRLNRCNELANVKRLKHQQLIQLFTTYGDCDQAIKWLEELKDTVNKDYSLADVDEAAVKNLRLDRQNLDQTAISTYEYGKQLIAMAKNAERTTMRSNPNDDRKERLEKAWKELNDVIQKNEGRLKVVESFMATHRQMLQRVGEIERSMKEKMRISGKLNSITMSVERRRLADDIDELSTIGKMLSAQINADHFSNVDERQTVMKQIADKIDEVVTAQRRMESLINVDADDIILVDDDDETSTTSSRDDRKSPHHVEHRSNGGSTHSTPPKTRPLSKVPEEDGETSPILPRAVRLLETHDGHAPAIRLSKNESYL